MPYGTISRRRATAAAIVVAIGPAGYPAAAGADPQARRLAVNLDLERHRHPPGAERRVSGHRAEQPAAGDRGAQPRLPEADQLRAADRPLGGHRVGTGIPPDEDESVDVERAGAQADQLDVDLGEAVERVETGGTTRRPAAEADRHAAAADGEPVTAVAEQPVGRKRSDLDVGVAAGLGQAPLDPVRGDPRQCDLGDDEGGDRQAHQDQDGSRHPADASHGPGSVK